MPAPSVCAPNSALRLLVDQTELACRAGMDEMPQRMTEALAEVIADPGLISRAARVPDPLRYARHLLHADPLGRFAIVALVWSAGQFSPAHGHHAWCAYAVHAGPLTETLYRYDPGSGLAAPAGSQVKSAGATSFAYSGLTDIHKLGNGGDNAALSIHIYGLDGARVGTHVNRVVPVVRSACLVD